MRTSWLTTWVAVLLAVTVRGDLVVPPPIVVNKPIPDGNWVLYMADVASGDESTLLRWGLRLEMVPEPRGLAMVTGLGLLILVVNRIARRKTSP